MSFSRKKARKAQMGIPFLRILRIFAANPQSAIRNLPCHPRPLRYDGGVKSKVLWPLALILIFALSRWPGAMPQNFSAAYALCFCAGLFLPRRLAWTIPLAVMALTDLLLTFLYYHPPGLFPARLQSATRRPTMPPTRP